MSEKTDEIKYDIDELLTPVNVAEELEHIGAYPDLALIIARDIYQPLLSVIKDLDARVKVLEEVVR